MAAHNDRRIQDLLRLSQHGLEYEPTAVLADALLETERPELGEDLALILSNRLTFPRERRGQSITTADERERALNVVFRRIYNSFAYDTYDTNERKRALREFREIERSWAEATPREREDDVRTAVRWLEVPENNFVYERSRWLLNGSFGRGSQILAEEILDGPSSGNREARFFQLVMTFENRIPPSVVLHVWRALTPAAKARASESIQRIFLENGVELPVPKRARTPRRR